MNNPDKEIKWEPCEKELVIKEEKEGGGNVGGKKNE